MTTDAEARVPSMERAEALCPECLGAVAREAERCPRCGVARPAAGWHLLRASVARAAPDLPGKPMPLALVIAEIAGMAPVTILYALVFLFLLVLPLPLGLKALWLVGGGLGLLTGWRLLYLQACRKGELPALRAVVPCLLAGTAAALSAWFFVPSSWGLVVFGLPCAFAIHHLEWLVDNRKALRAGRGPFTLLPE
jgi:hypothetical protein